MKESDAAKDVIQEQVLISLYLVADVSVKPSDPTPDVSKNTLAGDSLALKASTISERRNGETVPSILKNLTLGCMLPLCRGISAMESTLCADSFPEGSAVLIAQFSSVGCESYS